LFILVDLVSTYFRTMHIYKLPITVKYAMPRIRLLSVSAKVLHILCYSQWTFLSSHIANQSKQATV